jgi:hypothetical protein
MVDRTFTMKITAVSAAYRGGSRDDLALASDKSQIDFTIMRKWEWLFGMIANGTAEFRPRRNV